MNPVLINTGLLSLATPDLLRLQEFYQALLGIDPVINLIEVYVEFRLSGLRLGLYRSRNPEFTACLGAISICLQVSDLDSVLCLPVLQDLKISAIRSDFHGREVDFCDPDGNRIVIHQPSSEFLHLMGDLD